MPQTRMTTCIFGLLCALVMGCSAVDKNDDLLAKEAKGSTKSKLLGSGDSSCQDSAALIDQSKTDLTQLCGPGEIPVPDVVSSDGCNGEQVHSIQFKCIQSNNPPMPATGCQIIPIPALDPSAAKCVQSQAASLPALLCPLLGGAPPPPPQGPVPGPTPPSDYGTTPFAGPPIREVKAVVVNRRLIPTRRHVAAVRIHRLRLRRHLHPHLRPLLFRSWFCCAPGGGGGGGVAVPPGDPGAPAPAQPK